MYYAKKYDKPILFAIINKHINNAEHKFPPCEKTAKKFFFFSKRAIVAQYNSWALKNRAMKKIVDSSLIIILFVAASLFLFDIGWLNEHSVALLFICVFFLRINLLRPLLLLFIKCLKRNRNNGFLMRNLKAFYRSLGN